MAHSEELSDFGSSPHSPELEAPKVPKNFGRRHSAAHVPAREPAEAGKPLGRRASLKGGVQAPDKKPVPGRRASLSHGGPPQESPRMTRRASAAVASVRRASITGSVAATLSQARVEMRRLSTRPQDRPVVAPEESIALEEAENRALTSPSLPDIETLGPAEVLCGVQVRKTSDRAKAEETEGENAAPKMPENGKLLQKTPLFARLSLSDQALIFLAEHGEERALRFSEVLYKEGEKQNQDWMGLVISGQLNCNFHEPMDREKGIHLLTLNPGQLFGELGALNICQARTSTVAAEVDSKVLVIRAERIWEAVHGFKDDVQRLTTECESWRAFMSSDLASMCHPEIMRHLREASVLRKLVPGEEHQLCMQTRQTWSAAVIEHGEAVVKETGEVVKAKEIVNLSAVLGINSCYTILSPAGCQVAILDRVALWNLVLLFPKAREAYTRCALSHLPSATSDLSHIPMLQFLEGGQSFFRALAGSIKQRVAPPRTVAIVSKDVFETLVFLQQGLADVIFHGHKVRELRAGQGFGDLNLLGIQALSGMTVIATDFCVLQDLKKADLESHLTKHPVARSHWRELLKMRNIWKQDGAMEKQIMMLRMSSFFGDELSAEFMRVLHQRMEARIYFPEEIIQKEDDAGDVMYLLCEGQIERRANGQSTSLEPGDMFGETGLISNIDGPADTLTAKTTCAVMVLYRMNMIDTLKRFPEVKPHFEAVTRRQRAGKHEEGKESWNIYRMSCFKDCSSRFLYLVDLHLERHIYFSDEVVVTENTEGEDMYILYSGAMDVQVKGIKVGSLEGGMFFGEMAVLGLVKKRSATIIAMTLCDVRVLSRKSLEDAINEFPQELGRFEELAATRNRVSLERRNGGRVRHLCSFFRDCTADFAAAIADDMQDRLFTSGQVICEEGADHGSLFLIHQGAAAVSCHGKKVAELKSGDICGELVSTGLTVKSSATVTATDTCFMQELPKKSLRDALERYPEVKQHLRHLAALRMEWKHSHELQIFKWVSSDMASLLEKLITRWIFFRGDEIVTQGQPGSSLFMISIGYVEVLHDQSLIRELGPGDMFGELCALGAAPTRTSTVRCKDVSDLYVLAKAGLDALLKFHPQAQDALRKVATVRMRSDVERMSEKHVLLYCPLFQQSSRKFLDRISAHMEDRLFMEGEDLCKQGEKGDTMFVLLQGTLDVLVVKEGSNIKVNELHAGSVIGEIAVLGLANHRTATLRAQKVCLVQVLHRPILMKYLNEFPREIATFQEVGASRLTKTGVSKSTLFPQQVIFQGCSAGFLEELCKQLQRKIIFPQQVIVEEGSESQEMYAIAQGEAFVEKDGRRLGPIHEGSAFGEMAVLGLLPMQTATIKAERMCDLQYLNSYDLETTSQNYPEDRAKMLQVVATMMRKELAEITDEEILREVPLLCLLGENFIKRLTPLLQVYVARKDEEICRAEETFVTVLQGRACVQIDGVTVRDLAEGESYGEASTLGLVHGGNWEVKAASSSVCLYLYAKKDVMQKVLLNEGARLQELKSAADKRRAVEVSLKFMEFSQVQIDKLLQLCEECFCLADQELVSARQSSKNLLFVVAGKAKQQGGDGIFYEPGNSMVYMNKDAMPISGAVTAVTHCKFLLLNKRNFMKFIKAQPAEERDRLLQRLEPRQAQTPARLRQISSHITKRCLQAAKLALKENVKAWEKPKVRITIPHREASAGWGQPDSPSSRRSVSSQEEPKRKRKPPKKVSELDQQEALFCKDMVRLTRMANACAEGAMIELKSLRSEAEALRKELKSLTQDESELSRSALLPLVGHTRSQVSRTASKPRSARR